MLEWIAALAMTEQPHLECFVQGSKLLTPSVAVEEICAHIAARIAKVQHGPIRVAVRFTRAGVASAQVTRTIAGRPENLPDVSIATSDRAMSMQTVETLADEIAQMLASR